MADTKFTPGPWMIDPVEGGEEYWITNDHFDAGPARIVMNKADAHLIAAAPEMYEALEVAEGSVSAFMTAHGYPKDSVAGDILEQIKAALARARGEDAS